MTRKQTKSFRREQKLRRHKESQARAAQQAAEQATKDAEREPLLNELPPLTKAMLHRLDVGCWRGAEYINRRGGLNLIWKRWIVAYRIGGVGHYPEGGEPAWVYLAVDGNFYMDDSEDAYRRLSLTNAEPWQLTFLIKLLEKEV